MKNILIILSLTAAFFVGCVSEFEPKGIYETSGILVVEGLITDDSTVITLTTSVSLSEDLTFRNYVDAATVRIEREDGKLFDKVTTERAGIFLIETEKLDPAHRYRLYVEYDGNQYASQFLAPLGTSGIKEVDLTKNAPGESVYVRVTADDQPGDSPYFSWTVEERWEFHTELYASHREDGNKIRPNYINTPQNSYYCWGKNNTPLSFFAADKNVDGRIENFPVHEIDPSDRRLSLLYYVNVTQTCVRKETYDYFQNIRKNSQQTGTIFSPVPSEVNGNIKCLTDADKAAIGYIEVASASRIRKFFPMSEELYEPAAETCAKQIKNVKTTGYMLYQDRSIYVSPWTGIGPPPVLEEKYDYAPRRCVDCTVWDHASKYKPEWWPSKNL